MNVEEENLIQFVVEQLLAKAQPKGLKEKLKKVLDEEAGEFVVGIWRAMIYETIKIKQGIVKKPFNLY